MADFTVHAQLADGGALIAYVRDREEADRMYGEYLTAYPSAEVRMLDGDAVLATAGPKP